MEQGSIEREIHVEAAPEVVFDVISSPRHIREWWGAATELEAVPGAVDELVWGDHGSGQAEGVPITVVDVRPPHMFSFRWIHPRNELAAAANSLLVTFELTPSGSGTTVRLTETGWREVGWEAAVLEERYNEHVTGWDLHLGHLRDYVTQPSFAP